MKCRAMLKLLNMFMVNVFIFLFIFHTFSQVLTTLPKTVLAALFCAWDSEIDHIIELNLPETNWVAQIKKATY